jgi:hypothetical protein
MSEGRHIRLAGFTRVDRHEMIAKLRDALQSASADLIDFQMFSNTAINLSFEMREMHAAELGRALLSTGLALDDESLEALRLESQTADVLTGSLNVTFIHSEPDLRIPVPPIPG